jgi:UDP-N-acetyl-D-glucosamine dehydrogenase
MPPQQLVASVLELTRRLESREARVGVVGMGYVGLPLMIEKAKAGFAVIGIDRVAARVDDVNRGVSYISDVSGADLRELVGAGRIHAVSSFDVVDDLDVIVICVPTPLDGNLGPDLQYVEHVAHEIAARLRPGQLVSLESTTYPGTTDDILKPILEARGLKCGRDFFLAYSPERVDPGNHLWSTANTNRVVGGCDPDSSSVAECFYAQTIDTVVSVSGARTAELVKVFENTFRAVNIALVNEFALLCDTMGLDVWEVLDAAFTKPFGIMPFYPGPGVGGHCIPVDPHYLAWKARAYGFETRFIGLAGEINRHMPEFVVEKAARVLNEDRIAVKGSRILLVGLAYKADIADDRESPALQVFERLLARGANVVYHDRYLPSAEIGGRRFESVSLDDALKETDLTVILTAHRYLDLEAIVATARRVFDTRNATRRLAAPNVTFL